MPNSIEAVLKGKKQLTHNVWLLTFQLIQPKTIAFIPGQYVILVFRDVLGKTVQRLYSIASGANTSNELDLIVQLVPNGLASNYFLSLLPNDSVTFKGPVGIFTMRSSDRNKILLITGSGIAPIISMLKSYNFKTNMSSLHLFWGIPTYKDVYLLDFFKSLSLQNSNFDFKICLSQESDLLLIPQELRSYFIKGHVNDAFSLWLQENRGGVKMNELELYLCGGREITESLRQYVLALGAAQNQVFFEKY